MMMRMKNTHRERGRRRKEEAAEAGSRFARSPIATAEQVRDGEVRGLVRIHRKGTQHMKEAKAWWSSLRSPVARATNQRLISSTVRMELGNNILIAAAQQ
ncbi:hypothetical protein RIF29_21042 [Crotalaria pallida]|uniref:Uncharacterized protein n=1 Tax=Crotalaria pallida TaxID=3830 RepID=A0AAN9I813_CROPI